MIYKEHSSVFNQTYINEKLLPKCPQYVCITVIENEFISEVQ